VIQFTMALRNTLRQPRRTLLLGGAIAFGVIIICLSSGFTTGMETAVQNNVTLFSAGHLLVNGITASESGRMQNRVSDPTLIEKTREVLPEAISVSPTAQVQATVIFGSREQQLRVRGIDWASDKLFSRNLILTQGDWDSARVRRSIILGAQSARRFGLGLGDSVFVRMSTVSGQQNATEYKLGAVYDDTAAGGMTTALVPLADILADLNMKEGQYQSLAIFLADASQADRTAKRLAQGLKDKGFTVMAAASAARAAQGGGDNAGAARMAGAGGMGGGGVPGGGTGGFGQPGQSGQRAANLPAGSTVYRISTVTEMSGQMGAVLGSVRWIGATIFIIMLLLTAAGITNTYRMVLMERTTEIGMLRCIGFRRADIFRIFLYEAGMIAIAGSLAGIFISMPVGLLVHLIPFNPSGSLGSALSRGRLLFSPTILSLAFVSIAVMLASIMAVSGPARRAAQLLPVEALRKTA